MNIYYLKKFRREAHKLYGIIWYEDSSGDSVWNIGKRRDLVPYATVAASRYYSEKDAIIALEKLRGNYILTKVKETIYYKKSRKYNKQLAKL